MRKLRNSKVWIGAVLVVVLAILAYVGWNRLLMAWAKDPGLGVRRLHEHGVTGAGVSVAIIDGNIRTDHVEYKEQLAYYEEFSDFEWIPYGHHGSSVSSILVGKDTGVAPGASLYYFAINNAKATPADLASLLRHILTFNQDLPEDERIRVISISNSPGEMEGIEEFEAAINEAWQRGVFVIYSHYPTYTQPPLAIHRVGCPPLKDRDDPLNYTLLNLQGNDQPVEDILQSSIQLDRDKGYVSLFVPVDYRTLAGPREGRGGRDYGPKEYYYLRDGGDSWWPPYIGGVLALALQVNPELTPEKMAALLVEGVYELDNGIRLIAPEKVVKLAQPK